MDGKSAVIVAVGLGGCLLAQAADPGAYTAIAARNVFGLLPEEPIVTPPPPEAPLPKITLDGFMTVFGRPQALFKVAAQKDSPRVRSQEDAYVLAEGERQDEVKVMHIDMIEETVTFSNHGVLQQIPLTGRK